MYYSLLFDCSL